MNASELRLKARESLVGNYWPAVLAAFLASVFGALVTSTGGTLELRLDSEDLKLLFGDVGPVLLGAAVLLGGAVSAISLLHFILGGVVQLGYAQYLLKQQDREIGAVNDLFSQFDRFKEGFMQSFLRGVYVALWSLLLIIPGIVKSLAYAMTPFLMAEDPTLTAKEAIKLSQEKMEGHKWELFCLGFSFIGWNLLAVLTGGIGSIFLNPYINAAYAAFYRDKISPKTVVTYTCIDL